MTKQGKLPFLIVGAGRGGTSLLAALLDTHSQLKVGFEMFAVPELIGEGTFPVPGLEPLTRFQLRTRRFYQLMLEESRKHLPQWWGNKITTEQIAGVFCDNYKDVNHQDLMIDHFFRSVVGESKIVFILRDGRTCVRSKIARTNQPLEVACDRWKFSVRIWDYLRRKHTRNVLLRFEELLVNPDVTLARVCSFLEMPFESGMAKGVNHPSMLPEYRRDSIDASRTSLDNVPAGCLERIIEELTLCGYHRAAA